MGSIPLVALGVQQQQQPDLLSKYGQLLQLKNAQQQSQLQQQEAPLRLQALQQGVQQGGLQIQHEQQALKDQQAKTAALGEWDGSDINKLYPLILKHGGSSDAVMSLKSSVLEQQQKAAVAFKDTADGGKAQVETVKQKGDLIAGALSPLVDPAKVPDAQLPQVLTSTVQDLVAKQLLDPQHAQAAAQLLQSGNPQQIRQGIDQFVKAGMAQSQILQNAHVEAQTAQAQAAPAQAAANAAETARHNAVDERAAGQRISIEGARLAFERQKQGAQDDASIETQAQQVAHYELPLPPQSRMNPRNTAVMKRALEINPQLSSEGYATNQDFLSSKGKANAQVQSLNKLSAHLQELQTASQNAGFSPVGFTAAGKDLRLAEQLFSKEDVKFLSGTGVGTEGELNGLIEKTHSPIQSVRDSAIDTLSKFTADAARQLGDQYERGTKLKFDPNQHFTPTTVQMMQKNGGTSARGSNANAAPPASGPPPGATHIAPGSDGKNHYTNDKGQDLGVAP